MNFVYGFVSLVLGISIQSAMAQSSKPNIQFERSTLQVNESGGSYIIRAISSQASSSRLYVSFHTSGSASGSDYRLSSYSFQFEPGSTSAEIQLTMQNDAQSEGKELLGLQWNSNSQVNFVGDSQMTIEILDDEPALPVAEFGRATDVVEEKAQTIEVPVLLSHAYTQPIRISLSTSGTGSGDIQLSNYSIEIPAGQTSSRLLFTVRDDTSPEGDESATIKMSYFTNAVAGEQSSYSVRIKDNDGPAQDTGFTTSCTSYPGYSILQYCIHATPGSTSDDVLFYFHGAFGTSQFWNFGLGIEERRAMRLHWEATGQPAPTVVVMSLGWLWMLNQTPDANGAPATFNFISDQVIPEIERMHNLRQHGGRRLLMGISMGGFNALQLYLRRPQNWDRAAVIAPMIPLCDPFAGEFAIALCVMNDPYHNQFMSAYFAHDLTRSYFPNPYVWDEANPVLLGERVLNSSFPPLFITSGTNDDFGFYLNDKKFAEMGISKGADITWVSTSATHGGHDPNLIGDFILKK